MSIRHLPDSPPLFDTAKARNRWAAAKADYLAGAGGPEVCERHGLSLSTFRWRAKQEGWRRADQPAPFVAPDPPPEPLRPRTAKNRGRKPWLHPLPPPRWSTGHGPSSRPPWPPGA